MLKPIGCAVTCAALLLLPLGPAAAADDVDSFAANVSPALADVASGGSWSADKQGGFYRALLIMAPGDKGVAAHLFLQWLSLPSDNSMPTVVKTIPVKEVNDQKLGNATIEIGGEQDKDNEVTVIVSSYDFDADKDIQLFVKAGAPGTYTMEKAPPKGAGAPGGEAPKSNVPKDD